jgi:hypothetical protein
MKKLLLGIVLGSLCVSMYSIDLIVFMKQSSPHLADLKNVDVTFKIFGADNQQLNADDDKYEIIANYDKNTTHILEDLREDNKESKKYNDKDIYKIAVTVTWGDGGSKRAECKHTFKPPIHLLKNGEFVIELMLDPVDKEVYTNILEVHHTTTSLLKQF